MTRPKTTAAILVALRAMPAGGTRADIAQALNDKTPAASTDWITAALKRLAHAGHIRRSLVYREGVTRALVMWVATEPVVELAIASAEQTEPELLRHLAALRPRFAPVVPLKDGRCLVEDMTLTVADTIALARREVSVAVLRGLA